MIDPDRTGSAGTDIARGLTRHSAELGATFVRKETPLNSVYVHLFVALCLSCL